jgi:hypothetical protein
LRPLTLSNHILIDLLQTSMGIDLHVERHLI